jgi:hypothetical protein
MPKGNVILYIEISIFCSNNVRKRKQNPIFAKKTTTREKCCAVFNLRQQDKKQKETFCRNKKV